MGMYDVERVVTWDGIDYKVLDVTTNGFLIVAKIDDIKEEKYPLPVYAVKDDY